MKPVTIKNKAGIIILLTILVITLVVGLFKLSQTSSTYNNSAELVPTTNSANVQKLYPNGNNDLKLYDRNKYLDYSQINYSNAVSNGNTILFFAATSWCNTCTKLDEEIKQRSTEIPDNLTILKVDYDSDKQTVNNYYVTIQTTLILLDSKGSEITRWVNGDFDTILEKSKLN